METRNDLEYANSQPNENELENNNKEDKIMSKIKTLSELALEDENRFQEDKRIQEKLEKQLEWFNHFVDYVGNINSNLYNEACEYADGENN